MNPNIFGYPYVPQRPVPPRNKKRYEFDERGDLFGHKRIKAVKVYHREIKDPLETLGIGSMTNPYAKETYKYGGSLDLTFKNGSLSKTKNTLKKPKLPKNRAVLYGSDLENLIKTETKRQQRRADAKKQGKTITRRSSAAQKVRKTQRKQPQIQKMVFGGGGRKNKRNGGEKKFPLLNFCEIFVRKNDKNNRN